MQVNTVYQGILEIGQAAAGQGSSQGVAQEEGPRFDDMLQDQAQGAQSKPAGKPAHKGDKAESAEKPQQPQQGEQEPTAEAEGYAVAATLVMGQPTVVLEVPQAPAPEVQAVQAPEALAEAAAPLAAPEAAPEVQVQHAPEAAVSQEAPAAVEAAPQQGPQQAPVEGSQPAPEQAGVEAKPQEGPTLKVESGHPTAVSQEQDSDVDVQEVWYDGARPVFQQEKPVPVKVAENYEPVAPEEPEAPQQLADRLVQMLEQGDTRVEIALTPENLGRMTVEITRTHEGVLHVVLGAASEKATALLQQNSANLQSLLAANGQEEVHVQVQGQQPQEQLSQFLNPDGQNGQQQQGQQQKPRQQAAAEDFIQQLRLGLVDRDTE